jgi:hypothetical protein
MTKISLNSRESKMIHVLAMSKDDKYTTVRLPMELMEEIDLIIKRGMRGYKSRAEFIKEALRRRFEELESLPPPPLLEHFNLNEQGVRVLDRTIPNSSSTGRIIGVYFKPDKVICEHCESSNCRHVKFALGLPEVQKILRKKGWKIEE